VLRGHWTRGDIPQSTGGDIMAKALRWAVVLPLLAAGPTWAAVGELKCVSIDRKTMAAAGFEPQSLDAHAVAAPKGCGTVYGKAMVADFTPRGTVLAVALDSADVGAKHPDLVRFDFTGKRRFEGAPTVPLKRGMSERAARRSGFMPAGEYYHFGPATLKVSRGGRTFPVSVTGQYYIGNDGSGPHSYVLLTLCSATEGSCRFGGKVYGVRVVDGNSNFRFGDGRGLKQKDGTVIRADKLRGSLADRVWIDTTSGTFKTPSMQVHCGQLARVDGVLYRVSVREDGTKITAEPAGVGTGGIVVPGDKWSVTLIGTKNVLDLRGGGKPVDVPADQYVVADWEGFFDSDVPAKPHRIRSGYYVMFGHQKGKVFDVRAGAVTKIGVGAPLTATVTVSQSEGTVKLNALVMDASGSRVSYVHGPAGRPPAPKVTIYNDQREAIYSTTLKYG
jgi:hypothetical protein